jgi:hypothetical protein
MEKKLDQLMITVVDAATGVSESRPMNAEEIANFEAIRTEALGHIENQKAEDLVKESVKNKLAAFGLTEEEIKTMLNL